MFFLLIEKKKFISISSLPNNHTKLFQSWLSFSQEEADSGNPGPEYHASAGTYTPPPIETILQTHELAAHDVTTDKWLMEPIICLIG
jgi:hypothetical protein